MSERKVLNKYYPPDFDPSKIPKLREPKNKTFSIRIMAPFNMRCNVCGEYIYKGKKFNSRKENVDDEDFLGLRIFRFYIRCPKCVAEIAFKTDLKNTDYTLEAGATRLFEAEKLAQQMAEEERKEKEAEELNPMKVLENRTKASHKEMAQIDELEELREINARHAKVDTKILLEKQRFYEEHLERLQKEEEDRIIESIFGSKQDQVVKRLVESDSDEDIERTVVKKPAVEGRQSATEILMSVQSTVTEGRTSKPWSKTTEKFATKSSLAGLVKKRTQPSNGMSQSSKMSSVSIPMATVCSSGTKADDSNILSNSAVQEIDNKTSMDQMCTGDTTQQKTAHNSSTSATTLVASSALTLLGDYSDGGDSESN